MTLETFAPMGKMSMIGLPALASSKRSPTPDITVTIGSYTTSTGRTGLACPIQHRKTWDHETKHRRCRCYRSQ